MSFIAGRNRMIKRGKNTKSDIYYKYAQDAAQPISKRPETIDRRDGEKQKIRRHHFTEKDLVERTQLMKSQGRWIGPFNKWKTYWAITEALYQLGPNRSHLFGAVFVKVEELMKDPASKDSMGRTAWDRFAEKDARNLESGKDVLGRLLDSIRVLQRLGGANPYGLKLAQLGACINVYGTKDEPYIELKIGIPTGHDVCPINEGRSRDYPSSVHAVPSGYKGEGGLHVISLTEIGDPHHATCAPQPMSISQGIDRLTETE